LESDSIGNLVVEHHHRVTWHEATREATFQLERQFFFQDELGIAHRVAHLDIILECHVRNRFGIGSSSCLESIERLGPGRGVAQNLEQLATILERSIHPLPMERSDGMGSVADEQHVTVDMPPSAAHSAHDSDGALPEFLGNARDELVRIGKMAREELLDRCVVLQRFETGLTTLGKKERHCEATVEIGQRNQHESATWPDV